MEEKISVIMGVYNSASTIEKAIDSIINQTYLNWEIIICDDCSTDNTFEILSQYHKKYPKKIILIKNERNYKLAYSLNRCLEYASGIYIARMDGDDISLPERFEKQVLFLENNQNIDLVGTSMQRFDEKGIADIVYSIQNPNKYILKKSVPFNHATIMTYRYVYNKLGGYTVSKRTERSQDLDLWFRFFYKGFQGENIVEPLYMVRENFDAISRRTIKSRFNAYKTSIIGYGLLEFPLRWYLNLTLNFIFKSIVPSRIVLLYRKFQKNKYKKFDL